LLGIELQTHSWLEVLSLGHDWKLASLPTQVYAVVIGAFAGLAGPLWFLDRPQFSQARDRMTIIESEDLEHLQYPESNSKLYVQGHRFQMMAKLPGNQIVSMQRNRKQLLIDGLPDALVRLKVAHLSDVHLTGQLTSDFYRLAMDWIAGQSPDLIVLSGDIVDYESALQQIKPIFEGLTAPLGMAFILGNHDKRLPDPTEVCRQLRTLGWMDLGKDNASVARGDVAIELVGNELPWFERHAVASSGDSQSVTRKPSKATLKIGVAHSPDQFAWGVQQQCNLLLCGHTHGGQIRFPAIGPIVAPSWYGARYASGVFHRNKTTMHVSRGLSGVHPFRWGCMPEVSILELAPLELPAC
jgi:uncharacterized protein